MKKLLLLLFLSFSLNACSAEAKSLKVDEIYRSPSNNVSYEVVSSTELEITRDGGIILATYGTEGDRLRVVYGVLGTTIVEYFKVIPVGLRREGEEWDIYYSREKYEIGLLHNAAAVNDAKAVRSLLDKGIDVNSKGYNDLTALIWAAWKGHADIAKLLLDRGAQVNVKDGNSNTALLWAMYAGENGRTEITKLLLDRGAQVNAKTENGNTALMEAMYGDRNGLTDITKLLLDRGAEINAKNGKGETALKLAKENNLKAIIRILTNAGATE